MIESIGRRYRPRRIYALLCALLPLFLDGCNTVSSIGISAAEDADLLGMVYGGDHRPVAGASVRVDGGRAALTDADGHFVVRRLPFGTHHVALSREGRESVSVDVRFLQPTQIFYATMLSPADLLDRALEVALQGDLNASGNLISRAETLHPRWPPALFADACLKFLRGDSIGSRVQLRAAIRSGGTEPELYLALARLSALEGGRLSDAIAIIDAGEKSNFDSRLTVLRQELQARESNVGAVKAQAGEAR